MKPVFLTLHYTIFLVIFDREIQPKTRQPCVHLVFPVDYLIHSEELQSDRVLMPCLLVRYRRQFQRKLKR